MDLLSSIRKSGSRGGVNFSWDEVQTSQHRENYLGHSLMAPVGRWQKGKDLSWYAKGDDKVGENGETAEERRERERKEEIRKIKDAEEDALARALGLPVADRNVSGANAITVGEVNRMVKEVGVGEDVEAEGGEGRSKGFGDFVGNVEGREATEKGVDGNEMGGLVNKEKERNRDRDRDRDRERDRGIRRKDENRERRSSRERRHRHRSRSPERRRHRSRSGERHRGRDREEREARRSRRGPSRGRDREDREVRKSRRSPSPERRERRYRSRSPVGRTKDRDDRRDRPRRSRSPVGGTKDRDDRRDRPRRSRSPTLGDDRRRYS